MTITRYAAKWSDGLFVGKRSQRGRKTLSGARRLETDDIQFAELWSRPHWAREQGEVFEVIVMTKREADLLQRGSEWLGYLEQAGVDNWGAGYEYAQELAREDGYYKTWFGEDE